MTMDSALSLWVKRWDNPENFTRSERYDQIVSSEPYEDGFGIMRDTQTAKPQTFITGDGWFVYNLAVNLAQMPG